MSKLFNQAVKAAFKNEMYTQLPAYSLAQTTGLPIVWAGEIDFTRTTALGYSLWVCFLTHYRGENSFMIEVGWSFSGRFPALKARPSLKEPQDKDVFLQQEYLTRLPMLSVKNEYWWSFRDDTPPPDSLEKTISREIDASLKRLTKEEAERSAHTLVPRAMTTLIQYGVPFLNKFEDWHRTRGTPNQSVLGTRLRAFETLNVGNMKRLSILTFLVAFGLGCSHTTSCYSRFPEGCSPAFVNLVNGAVPKLREFVPTPATPRAHYQNDGDEQNEYPVYVVRGCGLIEFGKADWVYIMIISAWHDDEGSGLPDITMAVDNEGEIWLNRGHICGSIAFSPSLRGARSRERSHRSFFRNFYSGYCGDDLGTPWERIHTP